MQLINHADFRLLSTGKLRIVNSMRNHLSARKSYHDQSSTTQTSLSSPITFLRAVLLHYVRWRASVDGITSLSHRLKQFPQPGMAIIVDDDSMPSQGLIGTATKRLSSLIQSSMVLRDALTSIRRSIYRKFLVKTTAILQKR